MGPDSYEIYSAYTQHRFAIRVMNYHLVLALGPLMEGSFKDIRTSLVCVRLK